MKYNNQYNCILTARIIPLSRKDKVTLFRILLFLNEKMDHTIIIIVIVANSNGNKIIGTSTVVIAHCHNIFIPKEHPRIMSFTPFRKARKHSNVAILNRRG